MSRVTHFEIYADDVDRASKFYADSFGWEFEKWDGPMDYWMITTGPKEMPGINGGMAKRTGEWAKKQSSMGAVTIEVEDIDASLEKVRSAGGKIVMEKGPIAGVGWMANFEDPEGNMLGMMHVDPAAK